MSEQNDPAAPQSPQPSQPADSSAQSGTPDQASAPNPAPEQPQTAPAPLSTPPAQPTQPPESASWPVQPAQPAQPASPASEPQQPQPTAAPAPSQPGAPQAAQSAPGAAQPQQPANPYAAQPQPQQPTSPYTAQQPVNPYAAQPQPSNPYAQPAVPPTPYPYQQAPASVPGNGMAITAIVVGAFSILVAWTTFPGLILGIVAIVLAVLAAKKFKSGKTTVGKVLGIIGIVLSVFALILYLALGVFVMNTQQGSGSGSYSAASNGSSTAPSVPDGDSEYANSATKTPSSADEQAINDEITARLTPAKAQDAAFLQQIANDANDDMRNYVGYSMSDMGVDPMEYAKWATTDFNFTPDGAYLSDDSHGVVYVDATQRDMFDLTNAFGTKLTDLSSAANGGAVTPEAAGKALRDAMNETTTMYNPYLCFDVEKVNGTWKVTDDSWEDNFDMLFDSYWG